MGKLNTNYGNYCYQTGTTALDRPVTKYCTSRNDYSESTTVRDEEVSLQIGRIICCKGVGQMRYDYEDDGGGSRGDYRGRRVDESAGSFNEESDRDDELEDEEGHVTVVEAIDESRLAYRAEGNSNIVLALMDDHRVLRMRKTTISCPDAKGEC